jgi:hypothetical protein
MEDQLRKMSALQRVEYDFEILYRQQLEMQKVTKQDDVCLIRMHSKYTEKPYSSTSMIFITVTNPIRKWVISHVLNPKFDCIILACIMLNCFLLAIDDYTSGSWKSVVDTTLTLVFTGECCLKIFAMGFIAGKNSYLTDAWNILDFFVVTTGVYGLLAGGSNVSVLRTIRILRPLRTINSIPEMKVLTVSILASIPMLVDIFVLILMFILIFALVGEQIYGGNFSNVCFNIDGSTNYNICLQNPSCPQFQVNCGNTGCDVNQYCWDSRINPYQGMITFDNTPIAFLTIYTGMTMSGWSDTMRFGRSALNSKFLNDIYYYVLIVVGAFFLMQLTVAAIFVKFIESSKNQKSMIKLIEAKRPKPDPTPQKPEGVQRESRAMKWWRMRMNFYDQIQTNWFNIFTTFLIIVNTLVMGSEYYGMTEVHNQINDILNIFLNVGFAIEMIMKVIALGFRGYVADLMNIFDGFIVIMGILEMSLSGQGNVKGLLVLRAFRMLRIFKLARKWKTLKTMLLKLIKSMKAISYLGLLMLIIMFIYTLLGKQLFKNQMDDGTGHNPRWNFDNLFWSFVTVFQLLTTQDWNSVMANAVGPTNVIYALYFVSFILIGNSILLNLFLAILIEQFEDDTPDSDDDDLEEAELKEEEGKK